MINHSISSHVYLDHNATTAMTKPVVEFYINTLNQLSNLPLNPSSVHFYGQIAKKYMNQARKDIINAFNVDHKKFEFIFTSSGTESNHIVLSHFLRHGYVIGSNMEHSSIYENLSNKIPSNSESEPDLRYLEKELSGIRDTNPNIPILVTVMYANNETGLIVDINSISFICKKYGAYLHSDCSQGLGKIPLLIDMIDFMTFSSHKCGGPHGIGGLLIRKGILTSILKGGGQEFGIRHGSENVINSLTFSFAIKQAILQQDKYYKHTLELRNFLEDSLENNLDIEKESQDSYMIVAHKNHNRLPNTSMIILNCEVDINMIVAKFDMHGISISSGSACSSGSTKENYVLKNIFGRNKGIRVSMGTNTTRVEIEYFLKILKQIY